jgi:prepilin peptidase CpaA
LVEVFLLLAAASLLLAALSDYRAFRIPNIFPALLLIAFLGTRLMTSFSPQDIGHLIHFAVALVIGMLLFQMRWVGGGDAKLYAGTAIWFSGLDAAYLIAATGLSGFLLAVAYFLSRKLGRSQDPVKRADRRIPYGIAIAAGGLIMAAVNGVGRLVPGA